MDAAVKKMTAPLAIKVGGRIRQLRKQRGLTLKDVAYATGTTPQTIQRLEMGGMNLSVHWVSLIGMALDVEPHQLFADGVVEESINARVAAELKLRTLQSAFKAFVDTLQSTHEELR